MTTEVSCQWSVVRLESAECLSVFPLFCILHSAFRVRTGAVVAEVLIQAEGLSKRYGEGEHAIRVLESLDLEIRRTERVAIVGESGVGKSTLLHILGTLDRPSEGKVLLSGQNLFTLPEPDLAALRNREIGFIFQFHHLLPDFTALENVIFPAAVRAGRETAAAKARGRELLARVGLESRTDFLATKLSGGQKQRDAIARALMNQP